jgi:hypothetical protein
MSGTPFEVKGKHGTPYKTNLKNTQTTNVLLLKSNVHSTAWHPLLILEPTVLIRFKIVPETGLFKACV